MNVDMNFSNIDPELNFNNTIVPTEYYTIKEYCDKEFQNKFNLSILNYNVRSFFNNLTHIESLMELMQDCFNFIVFSETWLNPLNFESCSLKNYSGYHTYRTDCRSGGVSVFVRQEYSSELVESLCFCNHNIESCVVRVNVGNARIFVVGVYRPHCGTIDAFTDELESIVCSPIVRNSLIFIAGDMNVNMNDSSSNSVQNYVSTLNSLNYFSLINNDTRFSNNDTDLSQCRSAIDHTWVNELMPFESAIIRFDETDHRPCISHLNYDAFTNIYQSFKTIEFRPFKTENFEDLVWQLSNIDWNSILNINDPETSCYRFMNIIDSLYCNSFPLKIKNISEKRLKNPWLTPFVKEKINFKSQSLKNFKTGILSGETYNLIRNYVNRIVKKAKNEYYERSFDSFKTEPRKAWKLMHNLMGKDKSKNDIDYIFLNDEKITNNEAMANIFIDYFANVGNQLDNNLERSHLDPCLYVKRSENSFYPFPVSLHELENIINNLKVTKCNVNTLPVKLFKNLSPLLIGPLSSIINSSFMTGIFPSVLKKARLTPLFKSGNKHDYTNYRPISSLHYVSKIFERCMVVRLTKFFHKYDLFSSSQFGFLKGKSTADALIHLTEYIYHGLDEKKHNINIMIDLKKAFDTVNHAILLQKLQLYGIRGPSLDWFRSYLKDRECFLCVNNKNSQQRFLNIGVPQGSVLGPVLFLIYVNDLPNLSDLAKTTLYADDTTLTFSGSNSASLVANVNLYLENLLKWSTSNRLTINTSKTDMLLITNRNFENNRVILSNEIIPAGVNVKFLGTRLDTNLDFHFHINDMTTKVARNGGILYRIRDNLTLNARLNFYNSYVLPFLSYNIICWGSTSNSHLIQLFLRQKRIIRTITNSGPRDSTSPLFKRLKLLKLYDIFKFELLKYMFIHKNDDIYQSKHGRNLRSLDLLVSTSHRLSKTQQAVTFIGPHEWNKLPSEIKRSNSLNIFKNSLKNYLLQSY